jgi:ubiquinone/menaquinone biosynthesis C-methylase UbiE
VRTDDNSEMDVHPLAEPFAITSDSYERGRPEYPTALLTWLESLAGLGKDSVVLDLGAGTGKFTRGLLRSGARVIAVEPLENMRAELERVLPDVESLAGGAHAIPLADASCDLVTCAQSFHWFAETEAITEIARVLKPGGILLLVWNQRDLSDPLQALIETIQNEHHAPGIPTSRTGDWQKAMAATPLFEPLEEQHFAFTQATDHETALARALSTTSVARMDAKGRGMVFGQVAAIVPPGSTREVPFVADAYAFRRR